MKVCMVSLNMLLYKKNNRTADSGGIRWEALAHKKVKSVMSLAFLYFKLSQCL